MRCAGRGVRRGALGVGRWGIVGRCERRRGGRGISGIVGGGISWRRRRRRRRKGEEVMIKGADLPYETI